MNSEGNNMRFCRHCGYSDRKVRFARDMRTETKKILDMFLKEGEDCADEMIAVLRKHQKAALHKAGVRDVRNVLVEFNWDNSAEVKRKLKDLCRHEFTQAPEWVMSNWTPDNGGYFFW